MKSENEVNLKEYMNHTMEDIRVNDAMKNSLMERIRSEQDGQRRRSRFVKLTGRKLSLWQRRRR